MKKRLRQSHIFSKERHGHYVEEAWCANRLFEVEEFDPAILDPAVGWGTITRAAKRAGYQRIWGIDIVDRGRHRLGRHFRKMDFLKLVAMPYVKIEPFSVVCNPPFDHVREFCEKALELGASKVAMICLVRRLNAARWLQALPLQRVWLLTPRPSMPPGAWIAAGNKPGGGTQDFVWLILRRGYKGSAELRWLCRDK